MKMPTTRTIAITRTTTRMMAITTMMMTRDKEDKR